ncbi:MAG: hypothetical protein GPJ52_11100, partial [Candidatus Heimdallarchaeota archaeon]|nr:hypothetical protein [Candidatus Heimdallarchaeota archaeon]
MSLEKPKPYTKVFSFGILVIMSSWLQTESTRLLETTEVLDNFGSLADNDIQVILQEDSAKYETAYSNLNELYALNDQTHPLNYTQQDFDEVKIDFTVKMRSVNFIVQSTSVYEYSVNQLGASVSNNYSNFGFEFYLINNQLIQYAGTYEMIHADILDYVNASFVTSGDSFELPKIYFEKWTYHLYNNLSILGTIGPGKATEYIIHKHTDNFDLPLVNLSLSQLASYHDKYVLLLDRVDAIYQDLNNTLITLALAGVLMGFAISFENITHRRISMIVGLVILFLSIFYFTSAFVTLLSLAAKEAGIIGVQGFVF